MLADKLQIGLVHLRSVSEDPGQAALVFIVQQKLLLPVIEKFVLSTQPHRQMTMEVYDMPSTVCITILQRELFCLRSHYDEAALCANIIIWRSIALFL